MIYRYHKNAERQIKKLQANELKKLSRFINTITQANNVQEIPDTIFLKNTGNLYRTKLGKNYRVLLALQENMLIIKSITKRNEETYRHI